MKLGRCLDTLPERLALAQTNDKTHSELALGDEVTRRNSSSATRRAEAAGLDPTMTLEAWDDSTMVTYDWATWAELTALRPSVVWVRE